MKKLCDDSLSLHRTGTLRYLNGKLRDLQFCYFLAMLLQEITADPSIENPEVSMGKHFMKQHLRYLLSTLTPREQTIIRMRFGLEGSSIQLLSDIGVGFGICKERVRQLESKALSKLKRRLSSQDRDAYANLLRLMQRYFSLMSWYLHGQIFSSEFVREITELLQNTPLLHVMLLIEEGAKGDVCGDDCYSYLSWSLSFELVINSFILSAN